MQQKFPKTKIGTLEASRLVIGSNFIMGFSHRSMATSKLIGEYHSELDPTVALMKKYLEYDINTVIGPMVSPMKMDETGAIVGGVPSKLLRAARRAQEETGKEMLLIASTKMNTRDTTEGYKVAEAQIKNAKENGCQICNIAFDAVDTLMDCYDHTLRRVETYTQMIRAEGLIPMATNHNYAVLDWINQNHYDFEAFVTPYNCQGFYMQQEIEDVYRTIQNSKIPVLTIKAMASGRMMPFVGITFNYATIRDCDMVAIGAMTADEAEEDIQIALGAIERKPPEFMINPTNAIPRKPTQVEEPAFAGHA